MKKDFKVYDKVLVRDHYDETWCARFYDYHSDLGHETTSGEIWNECIPFNDETKVLHGTNMSYEQLKEIEKR